MPVRISLSDTRLIGAVLAVAFLIVIAAFVKKQPTSWNDISHVAAIQSLVERGTWVIDGSPWAQQTVDKVLINGQFYSDKMPLLSFLGAGVYALLRTQGMSLAPDCAATTGRCGYYWLTLIIMGLPAALLVALFWSFARVHAPLWAALAGTLALATGTMVTPYTVVFNHHLPGAVGLFASFYIITMGKQQNPRWIAAAGLLAALAPAFDGSSGIVALGVAAMAVGRYRKDFIYFALGAAAPVIATVLIDCFMVHTFLPPYLVAGGYDYPGAAAATSAAGLSSSDNLYNYAFRIFVGAQGVFAYNPLLLFALAGAVRVAVQPRRPLHAAAVATLVSFVVLGVYLALNTGNYGGEAYGLRFFVPVIPIAMAFILFVPPLSGITWRSSPALIAAPLLALSLFSTYQGARRPWLYTPPPVHLARLDEPPFVGIKWEVKLW
ncbi:MAG: hypothetical protein WCF84_10255 [Anaerolineae bacterium]